MRIWLSKYRYIAILVHCCLFILWFYYQFWSDDYLTHGLVVFPAKGLSKFIFEWMSKEITMGDYFPLLLENTGGREEVGKNNIWKHKCFLLDNHETNTQAYIVQHCIPINAGMKQNIIACLLARYYLIQNSGCYESFCMQADLQSMFNTGTCWSLTIYLFLKCVGNDVIIISAPSGC